MNSLEEKVAESRHKKISKKYEPAIYDKNDWSIMYNPEETHDDPSIDEMM